jgi:hypothetical protein
VRVALFLQIVRNQAITRMHRRNILLCALTTAVSAAIVAGCASGPPQSRLASHVTTDTGKVQALRYRVFGYVGLFSATVEGTADVIAAATSDTTIRRNALLWKMNGIPAGLTATVHPDALATLLDVWTLSAQMEHYFSDGAGKGLFGAQQRLAIAASQELTAAAVTILRDFMPPDLFNKTMTLGGEWVASHPLKTPLFARDSAVELVAPLMGNQGGSALAVIAKIEDRVDSLTARVTLYGPFIPKFLRWQAELMLLDAPDALITIEDRLLLSVQDERKAVIEAIDQQRLASFDQIRDERIALTKELEAAATRLIREGTSAIEPLLDRETTAAFGAIEAMRLQSVKDVREFLITINQRWLDTLTYTRGEREAATKDAEQIAIKAVDRVFHQLYQLIAILFLAAFAGGAILIVLWKKLV